jgi:hypothetical protein
MGEQMAKLPGNAPFSRQQPAILDDAAAYSGAVGEAEKVLVVFAGTKTGFSQSGCVGIVQHKDRPTYSFPEDLPYGKLDGGKAGSVMPGQNALGFVVDLSGHGNRQNIVIVVGFRHSDGFFCQNFHGADSGRGQPLIPYATIGLHQSGFDGSAANIQRKYPHKPAPFAKNQFYFQYNSKNK